jgi:hypothetical protein
MTQVSRAPLYTMTAEIIFLNPADMNPAIAELIELDQSAFFDWLKTIVEPLGGDVVEAGHAVAMRDSRLRKTV